MWVVIIFLCWQISFYTICNGGRLQYMNGCEYGCSAVVALTVRRIELRYSEKNFSQCHCVIHKPYADGLESRRVSAVRTADVKNEVISFTFMWPCIVTDFFVIKPTRCTNFTNLFCHETLHVSESSFVHHQEFIHCTLGYGICHTGL